MATQETTRPTLREHDHEERLGDALSSVASGLEALYRDFAAQPK